MRFTCASDQANANVPDPRTVKPKAAPRKDTEPSTIASIEKNAETTNTIKTKAA